MTRLTTSGLLLIGLATAGLPGAASDSPAPLTGSASAGRNPEAKPRPRFTVGRDTTYVIGPCDPDGRIDFVAALNERMRRGVTPASNANVLLWRALGPRPEGAAMPPEFFKWLGVEAPPERGDYFISLYRFARDRLGAAQADIDALYEQLDQASQAPWTAKQYPALASWLKASEKPLALVVAATQRTHYFSPLVPSDTGRGEPGLISALLPAVQRCREIASALPARAMLRAGEGRHADAWRDLLACHRLGRHVARGGTLIEGLVGIAIEHIASGASLNYLGRARLSARQVKDCLRDLRRLPPMPEIADRVDLCERFMFLEIVVKAAGSDGLDFPEAIGVLPLGKGLDARARRALQDIDWDAVLRTGNRWYNRLVAAMRVEDSKSRERQLDQLETDLRKLKQDLTAAGPLDKSLLAARNARARGTRLGHALISLLIPAVRKVNTAGDRVEQVGANVQVAFALAAYRREHGRYPAKLEALAPAYLPRIPQDRFSGKALIYRPVEGGYYFYSVGANGRDEQGRSFDDDPPGDDLVVRMPRPKLPRN